MYEKNMKSDYAQLMDIVLEEVNVKQVRQRITENLYLVYDGNDAWFEVNGERKEISEKNKKMFV